MVVMSTKRFEVKSEHLKLLPKMYWGWQNCEFGAPEVDPKRPYGNKSVVLDIMNILGEEPKRCRYCDELLEGVDEDKYVQLHKDMEQVLDILTDNAENGIRPGIYQKGIHSSMSRWAFVLPSGGHDVL
jgi:hypothetical protein